MFWKTGEIPTLQDVIKGAKTTAYAVAVSPWSSAIGGFVGSLLVLRLYCRYTVGMCRCKTDLTGKTAIVTGGNAGIGKETAMELARRNAKVIIACKSASRGTQAVEEIKAATGNQNVLCSKLDLSSFSSVRRFIADIKQTEDKLHILVNNAGITGTGGKKMITEDGCEQIMQTNYIGHFLLTLSLADLLKKSGPSRIINVSSMVYAWGSVDVEDLHSMKKFKDSVVYNNSKLAQVLSTLEMSKRLAGTGVTVNALHPGVVHTGIAKNLPGLDWILTRFLFFIVGKTPREGAQTTLHLALSPELENVSGKYFSDCKEKELSKITRDEDLTMRLWRKSEEIVRFRWETIG